MSSWKCGRKVAVNFCTRSNGYLCDSNRNYGESAGGGAESQDTGIDNSLTRMVLTPYEPSTLQAITVFSETQCHGDSAVLWSDKEYSDTINGENRLTLGNNIMSVMLPEGSDWQVDLYAMTDFVTISGSPQFDSTIRHNTGADKIDDRNDCINVSGSKVRGSVNSIKFSNTSYEGKIPIN